MTHCGFIAILGEPNAGKSTLINQIVGSKVSIVSPKVQTTRRRIFGLTIMDDTQLIFMDTPGIFEAKRHLEKAMVKKAYETSQEADCTLLMVDVCKKNLKNNFDILDKLNPRKPLILLLNKIDQIPREQLFAIAEQFGAYSQIQKIFMISALTGDGVQDLTNHLKQQMPEGVWLYPEDQLTDLPLRLWAAEITREQLVLQLQQELPYETYVETELWENFKNGSVKINQKIIVAKDGQKSIILGHRGQRIKAISQAARLEIERHLGHPVHLFLFVKVRDDWMSRVDALRAIGVMD